jgi:TDG/mug DNA glycosylase family protein
MNASPTDAAIKRSFSPVTDGRTRLLVLGSLPGEVSLAQARYYAHPFNQFWRLIGVVIGRDLVSLDYAARLEALLGAGIGLWDVVGSASRTGSLDANIRDHRANDLASLAGNLPALRAVAFNGGKSASIGMKLLGERTGLALLALPSSSPAYTVPFEAKRLAWEKLKQYL